MTQKNKSNEISITRVYDAPVKMVWDAWTDPKQVEQWWGPRGAKVTMYARASYLEIVKPNHIVHTQQFCDEKENIARHPFAPTWPETMLTTVTLEAEDAETTRVKVKWQVHGPATHEERDTFTKSKQDMTQGWTGSFDKLESYLTRSA